HRVPRVALLLARVVDAALAELRQVVATAKALARALDHDDVHLRLRIGPLDGGPNLAGRRIVDRVQALGAVEQQSRDAWIAGVLLDIQGAVVGHGVLSVLTE